MSTIGGWRGGCNLEMQTLIAVKLCPQKCCLSCTVIVPQPPSGKVMIITQFLAELATAYLKANCITLGPILRKPVV